MCRLKCLQLAVLVTAISGWSSLALAQFGGSQPGSSPTYSPYLNLLRGGNSGIGQNYFGLVQPQQQFAQQNQALGQGLQSLQMQGGMQGGMQQTQGGYGYSQLGATGHPVIFNSFGTSRFSGGYTGGGGSFGGGGGGFSGGGYGGGSGGGSGGGGFSGGQFGGGGGQFGGQSNFSGVGTTGGGFGGLNSAGVSGHVPQFGGIGNTYRPGR